jgi:beta-lactamase regulating signal transducer with metallopeptidase domain
VTVLAIVGLAVAAVRSWRYVVRVRHERRVYAQVRGVEVVAAAGPLAFAVPGPTGGVVLGDELVRTLDVDERRAVLAHERAHLDLHHHRYVRAAELCAKAVPVLVPIARQVRHSTERWADEAAAAEVGSRALVARTIARVALLDQPTGSAMVGLRFAGSGAMARVEALLAPPADDVRATTGLAVGVLAVTLAGSAVQVHHLGAFLLHACLG